MVVVLKPFSLAGSPSESFLPSDLKDIIVVCIVAKMLFLLSAKYAYMCERRWVNTFFSNMAF
jgi:hypothetical protein